MPTHCICAASTETKRPREEQPEVPQAQDVHPSVVRQTDCNLLSRARALATLARMSDARAVQMNGLGLRL